MAGLLVAIVLIFTSSTFVPVATMPDGLRAFAELNPVTKVVDGMRALCLGGPATRPVLEALAWLVGILALCIPLAVRRYGHTAAEPASAT